MAKRHIVLLVAGLLAGSSVVLAATVAKAPSIQAIPREGEVNGFESAVWQPSAQFGDQAILDSIGPEADQQGGTGVLGTPGKNLWASQDGETVLAVYGPPSGTAENIFNLWVAYSYDRGHNWDYATSTIGPGAARRIFPGVICPSDILIPYVAYQHTVYSGGSYISSDIYFSYDELFPSMQYTPIRVGPDDPQYHAWLPCVVTTPDGDTVLVSWANSGTGTATGNCYLKRSFDGGLTWSEPEILMVNSEGTIEYDAADAPRMQMSADGYVFALFNWRPTGTDRWVPCYLESTDYGATWSLPQTVWVSWPPYPDATCWWHVYDTVLDPGDHDRPHCAIRLGASMFEYGDIWECHPRDGQAGNWSNWVCTCVVGNSNGDNVATQPSLGRDRQGDLFITFSAWFVHAPGDTSPDVGVCYSHNRGTTWLDTVITHDDIIETAIELAPLVGDSLHLIYVKEMTNCQSVWHVLSPNPLYGGPEMVSAEASDGEVRLPGVDEDDYVTIVFNEPTTTPVIQSSNIDSVLALSSGHTWLDGAGNIEGTVWKGVGDTLEILLSTQSGVPTISPGDTITPDGVTITDPEGKPCIREVVLTGDFDPVGSEEQDQLAGGSTKVFALSQNYPNPAEGWTEIRYQLPRVSEVHLAIYDLAGRLVEKLADGERRAGQHVVRWDVRDGRGNRARAGVYLCRLKASEPVPSGAQTPAKSRDEQFTATRKLVVLR